MDFSAPARKPRSESIVPMINVVFLLLIFFLMTSNLAQPHPFEITPPGASSEAEPQAKRILYVDKTGRTSFEGLEGDAVLTALTALRAEGASVQIRADAELEAKIMAGLMRDLARAGLTRTELIVVTQ